MTRLPLANTTRRAFLAAGAMFTVRGMFADELLLPSPPLTEGPF